MKSKLNNYTTLYHAFQPPMQYVQCHLIKSSECVFSNEHHTLQSGVEDVTETESWVLITWKSIGDLDALNTYTPFVLNSSF